MSSSINRIPADDDDGRQSERGEPHDSDVAEVDRERRLASIKGAIDAGLFDDDAVLEEALRRMLKRMQSE